MDTLKYIYVRGTVLNYGTELMDMTYAGLKPKKHKAFVSQNYDQMLISFKAVCSEYMDESMLNTFSFDTKRI